MAAILSSGDELTLLHRQQAQSWLPSEKCYYHYYWFESYISDFEYIT